MPDIREIIQKVNEEKSYRSFSIERAAIDEEARTIALSFSSEEPVERWFGHEILDHKTKSVNLGRLKRGGSMLIDHDTTKLVGVIEEVSIDEQAKKGRALVRFGKRGLADDIFRDVLDGIRPNVSVGYMVDEMVLEKEQKDAPDTYRVSRWTPYEISSVSVPADITVGVGRKIDTAEQTIEKGKEKRTMDKCTTCQADLVDGKCEPCTTAAARKKETDDAVARVTAAAQRQSAEHMEKDRIAGIEAMCKMNKLDDKYREMWISQGTEMKVVADDILKILEERGKSNPQPMSKIGMSPSEANQFSLIRAIDACCNKDWSKAGYELEITRAVADKMNKHVEPTRFLVPFEVLQRPIMRGGPDGGSYRDLTAGTTGAGGYLVDTQNMGFIELLYNRSVALQMGARRLSGLTGNVTIPRQTAGSTAYWLTNEATQATETNLTFDQVSLTPKNVAAYVEISRQLMLQSSPGAEGIVSDDLAKQVAVKVDLAALEGSGTEQPTGISGTAGIGAFTGATLAYAAILNAQEDLATSNVVPIRGGYVATPAGAALAMQRVKFTSTASPLWEGNLWDGSMAGFPAMSSNQLTAGTMIFGDWQELVLAEWGVLEIEVNPYANFQAGIVGVRAMYSMDIGVRRAAAFTRATGIT
jgi:HK97 family phage major capsid protein